MEKHPRHVWHFTFLADTVSPLRLFGYLTEQKRTPSLFESVIGGERWGTHTLVIADPLRSLRKVSSDVVELYDGAQIEQRNAAFFDTLRELLGTIDEVWHPCPHYNKVYSGPTVGFYGLLGYPVMQEIEPRIPVSETGPDTDDVYMFEPGTMFVYNNVEQLLHVLLVREDAPTEAQRDQALAQISGWLDAAASRNMPTMQPRQWVKADPVTPKTHLPAENYKNAVEQGRKAIFDGEAIQVVLAQRFDEKTELDALELYRFLRVINPSPYLYLLSLPHKTLIGSSPEVMVRLRDDRVSLRPIAGTRKRGQTPQEDAALEQELLADPKELAEHLMLVDLGRNDLGRIAAPGSVEVPEKFIIERYSHVMHIVSQVEARLQQGLDAIDVVKATFPAGTVSGAPKVRACQLIHEFEHLDRGAYSGAVGYFDARGNMDTCIVIRTFVQQGSAISVTAGAGVVYDSDPEAEYQESVNKAKALFTALTTATQSHARASSTLSQGQSDE